MSHGYGCQAVGVKLFSVGINEVHVELPPSASEYRHILRVVESHRSESRMRDFEYSGSVDADFNPFPRGKL